MKEYRSSEYPNATAPSTIVRKGDSIIGRVLTTEVYCTRTLSWVALRRAVAERVPRVSMHPSVVGESVVISRRAAVDAWSSVDIVVGVAGMVLEVRVS